MPLRLKKYPKRSPYWIIRGTVAGRSVFESSETTDREKAEAFRLKKEVELYDGFKLGKRPPVTFAEALEVYLDGGGEEKGTEVMLKHFAETPVKDIGPVEMNKAAKLLYPTAKDSTINRALISKYISIVKAAQDAEMPHAILRPIKRRKEEKITVTPADAAHVDKLIPELTQGELALIWLISFTGLRSGEAMRHVNEKTITEDGQYAIVGKTKNGEPRMVALPVGWKYPEGGYGHGGTSSFGKALRKAHERAGLPYKRAHNMGRHTFSARILADGHTLKELKDAGGWKKLQVVDEIYGHLERTRMHDAVRDISSRSAQTFTETMSKAKLGRGQKAKLRAKSVQQNGGKQNDPGK